jgi:murein DD-endopeptidase MepM/ murein hydrolase activator NlpD
LLCAVLIFTACSHPNTQTASPNPISQPTAAKTKPSASATVLQPTASPQPTPTALPPTATTIGIPRLCSPLQDIPLEQISQIVSSPFHPPPPGSDDPHHGVDLAVVLPNSTIAVSGRPVQAAIAGRVAAVINDRFPYGNALLVEVPLDGSPADWWLPAQIPTPAPTLENHSALTCPDDLNAPVLDPHQRSLYVLYAHLLEPVQLNVGDPIACGQVFGAIGSSGNALNPHLHFETRVGPSGLILTSMAHYDNSATPAEMSSYCLWRISGLFQLVDPLKILTLPSIQ